MKRLQLAAEAGDALAQFNLGIMFDHGMDDNEHPRVADRGTAIRWFLSAAKQGLPRAQLKLAQTYAGEIKDTTHRVEAAAWFLRAAEGSSGADQYEAQKGFKRVSAPMSEDEIEAARALARRWAASETYVPEMPTRGRRR
jgi:TPR repeat protein